MLINSSKKKGRVFETDIKTQFDTAYNFGKYDLRFPCASVPGCDIIINSELAEEVMLYAPECKRTEKPAINTWWQQCTANAELVQLEPVLFWRQSRRLAVAIITQNHWSSFELDDIPLHHIIKFTKFHTAILPTGFEPICFLAKPYPSLVMIWATTFFNLIDRLVPDEVEYFIS